MNIFANLRCNTYIVIILFFHLTGEKCVVSVKESPKDPAGSSLILISKLGTSKTVTCVYEASSSCSDVIVKIYHRTAIDHKAYPVDGSYWGLTRGLSYVVSPSKRNGNEYSVSMTIEAFYNGYSGWYHCVINETSNMSNSDSSVFTIFRELIHKCNITSFYQSFVIVLSLEYYYVFFYL